MAKRRDVIKKINAEAKRQGMAFEVAREGANHPIEPDLTWLDTAGKPVTVIDAMYKTLTVGRLGPNADMCQLTAYCTALGLCEGDLVYAKGDVEPRVIGIVGADITICCHALDLALPPADVLTAVDALIDGIGRRLDIATD
ncbi:5-methylcytosine restriction system specificity protein McrC [Rhodococcus globerulus]|uniref:Uncharacterized protein n=1 Tax=Rhodococcus globerulus TaxID=33008 RepID=A0ABU4C4M9_RHOGO|nr:hypothetical protein [Rhodococcus globerulus]MDV6271323.1 hypothetical protein [Rhodococcus globerulus]